MRRRFSNEPSDLTNQTTIDSNLRESIELIRFSQYNICKLFNQISDIREIYNPYWGDGSSQNEKCDDGIPSTEQEDNHAK